MSTKGTKIPDHLRLPLAGVTPAPTEEAGQELFPTGNFRFYRPVYRDKTPPCNHACPTGEQIQRYLDFVKHDRVFDGYMTIIEDNPMPSVTGRVCYHPCEGACNRKDHDEPIGIRNVERFLGDFGLKLAENPIKETVPPTNGKRIAVVGSGPGGLACAYHARRLGYKVTVLEAQSKPGGMLRGGIPHWHLPEDILNQEVAKIEDLGDIEIRCNTRVGQEVSWDDLKEFDAAFVSVGQDVGRRLPVEGNDLRGVVGAMEFLREAGYNRPVEVGKKTLVIGGGNTASDAARSAMRLGAEEATIVSLESADELLIVAEDQELAKEEGVQFKPNEALARVIGENGVVKGAVLCKASLEKDEQGNVAPRMEEGTEYEVDCDTILIAIGQGQQLDWIPEQLRDARGLLKTDPFGRLDGNIFAGGDIVRGPAMVVDALGDGKRAAANIDKVLGGIELAPDSPVEVMPYERLNTAYFRRAPRIEAENVPAAERVTDQKIEVTLAYSQDQAVSESDRCMSCGVCNGCDNCYIVCPDVSVVRDVRVNGHYHIRTKYCKGCLVCVQECPTGCLEKVPELDFDEEGDVSRMETAFSIFDGSHATQSAPIGKMHEDAMREYDESRKAAKVGAGGEGR
jgi:NADPH-dependent glutamate synthase beta subunit-like oxidoreductase/Pyruvate/2-oxoacid:ferredoxin oxidoreductase delta subunit